MADVDATTTLDHATTAPVGQHAEGDLERALAEAILEAAKAQRFDVVAQLATELHARRLAGSNVVALPPAGKRGRR